MVLIARCCIRAAWCQHNNQRLLLHDRVPAEARSRGCRPSLSCPPPPLCQLPAEGLDPNPATYGSDTTYIFSAGPLNTGDLGKPDPRCVQLYPGRCRSGRGPLKRKCPILRFPCRHFIIFSLPAVILPYTHFLCGKGPIGYLMFLIAFLGGWGWWRDCCLLLLVYLPVTPPPRRECQQLPPPAPHQSQAYSKRLD